MAERRYENSLIKHFYLALDISSPTPISFLLFTLAIQLTIEKIKFILSSFYLFPQGSNISHELSIFRRNTTYNH